MFQFRLATVFAILSLTASSALAQDVPPDAEALLETRAPSIAPFLFSASSIGLALGFTASLAVALGLAYRANRISGPTVCFIVGAVLVISPIYGSLAIVAGNFLATAKSFAELGGQAPNPNAMNHYYWATMPLTFFSYLTWLAAPLGVVAVVAAFFFKKPGS